ncbi:MAG TPA: protein kinase [Chloroflexia bacterium]|nr:protein kinase [Chloroflexia bacterium]
MPTRNGFNPRDLLNQTIGGYQLVEVLGMGNAAVYRAYDPGKGEYVAVKLVSWPGAQIDETALRRFKREIDLLRKRRHAAIIDIYDWRTAGDYVYMAMECCDGTLERWLQQHHPTLNDVLQIAEPLAAALDFLHGSTPPVIHRDIKPANILFKGNNWYISDFGIARMEADQLATTDGTLLGTLRYAAPEQIMGGKPGPEMDVYSFGLVVHQMLAGSWVFGPRRRDNWAYDVPPLSRYRRDLGPAVDDLFARWLAPDPAQRPRRAADAVRELAATAGILRDPALARLYDLATELAARPRSPEAWAGAANLLAVVGMHEPAFSDPRGLGAELQRRRAGATPGPDPPGYTAAHPPSFYSEATVVAGEIAPPEDEAGLEASDGQPAPEPAPGKLTPPADAGERTFAPRTRYDAVSTLQVPADARVAGSVFGHNVVVEAGARVDGDIYSLGDLTLGAGAEVGGMALAGDTLVAGGTSRVQGSGGAQGGTVRLGPGARLTGWATAAAGLTAEGAAAGGMLAGADLALNGAVEIGATAAGSAAGVVRVDVPVRIGGTTAGSESVHAWHSDGPDATTEPPGQALSSVLTRRGRGLAEDALRAADTPATLTAAQPVDTASEGGLPVTPATEGPTLYLPTTLARAGDDPPSGLPAEPEAWEGPLAGAWMIAQVWREFAALLRVPAICAVLFTLLCWGAAVALLAGGQGGAAGLVLLIWVGALLVAAGLLWMFRPRPLELVRLWWAWETWPVEGGVLLWDTLDAGREPGYLEPAAPLPPLADLAAAVAAADLPDTAVQERLAALGTALETLAWQSWPGVFAPKAPEERPAEAPPSVVDELLQLPVDVLPAEQLPGMLVLAPRLDPEQVRAGADRLAAWPAYQAAGREVWHTLNRHLDSLDDVLATWRGEAATAAERAAGAAAALDAVRARAVELADETFAALETEIGPDLDRVGQLHVEGGKLISASYERIRDDLQATLAREHDRLRAQIATTERKLQQQETVLSEIDAELQPLTDRWHALAALHERTGAALRQDWKQARAQTARAVAEGDLYVSPRPIAVEQAPTVVAQAAQDLTKLARQAEDLEALCAKDEQDLPVQLPWPAWPAQITAPLAVDSEVTALSALLRRVRNEPVRARGRLDTLNSLRARVTHTLERALGAQETLAGALAAERPPAGAEPGRLAGAKSQADGLAQRLYALAGTLARLQRRLEVATVAYDEVADNLAYTLKGGRGGTTWDQARRLQDDFVRLQGERTAALNAVTATGAALATAHADAQRLDARTETEQQRLSRAEKDLIAWSEEYAGREEATLRRHVELLRARHAAVLAGFAPRRQWLDALAAFDAAAAQLKIDGTDRLRERVRLLAALADGRIAETAAARADALWPADSWPATDMLYLVPLWLLRYRPLGARSAPRLCAVTPGTVRAAPPRRFALTGFAVDPQPGFAARFAADVLTWANRRPGLPTPLEGANLLAPGANLPARWQALAAHGLVPPWLGRLL